MDIVSIFGTAASILVPLFGGIVWLVRLEGRLNVQDARLSSTEKRVDGLEERIFNKLDRIEARLENMIESRNGGRA